MRQLLTGRIISITSCRASPFLARDSGLGFYRDRLGHEVRWRNDELGHAGLGLPDTDTEIVLTTRLGAWCRLD